MQSPLGVLLLYISADIYIQYIKDLGITSVEALPTCRAPVGSRPQSPQSPQSHQGHQRPQSLQSPDSQLYLFIKDLGITSIEVIPTWRAPVGAGLELAWSRPGAGLEPA